MRVQSWRSFVTAGLLLFCIGLQVALGDIFGRISGTAKDPSGAVIPGVTVTAACVETGIRQTTQTDVQGFYAFPSLAVGHYDINASLAGFKDFALPVSPSM